MPRAVRLVASLFLAPFLLAADPGRAAEVCAEGSAAPTHRIQAAVVRPGSTARPAVTLVGLEPGADNSVTVVLDGVILLAKSGEAARAVNQIVVGLRNAPVSLVPSTEGADRHGRLRGVLRFKEGDSLGERLLAAGAGVADVSFTPCAARFLAAEQTARAEKRGIWRQRRIWTDLNAAAAGLPDFVLGRGRVASVGRSGRTTYINFGGDFRTDATLRLGKAVTSALIAAGRSPDSFSGRMVEVRGWASQHDGLDMELESPLALQLSGPASDTRTD